LGAFSTVTAHPGLQSRYKICAGTAAANREPGRAEDLAGFAGRPAGRAGLRVRETLRDAVLVLDRLLRDALIVTVSTCSQIPAAPGRAFLPLEQSTKY
jgi:hypothetical protein